MEENTRTDFRCESVRALKHRIGDVRRGVQSESILHAGECACAVCGTNTTSHRNAAEHNPGQYTVNGCYCADQTNLNRVDMVFVHSLQHFEHSLALAISLRGGFGAISCWYALEKIRAVARLCCWKKERILSQFNKSPKFTVCLFAVTTINPAPLFAVEPCPTCNHYITKPKALPAVYRAAPQDRHRTRKATARGRKGVEGW